MTKVALFIQIKWFPGIKQFLHTIQSFSVGLKSAHWEGQSRRLMFVSFIQSETSADVVDTIILFERSTVFPF